MIITLLSYPFIEYSMSKNDFIHHYTIIGHLAYSGGEPVVGKKVELRHRYGSHSRLLSFSNTDINGGFILYAELFSGETVYVIIPLENINELEVRLEKRIILPKALEYEHMIYLGWIKLPMLKNH